MATDGRRSLPAVLIMCPPLGIVGIVLGLAGAAPLWIVVTLNVPMVVSIVWLLFFVDDGIGHDE